jgi:hypothetical protein
LAKTSKIIEKSAKRIRILVAPIALLGILYGKTGIARHSLCENRHCSAFSMRKPALRGIFCGKTGIARHSLGKKPHFGLFLRKRPFFSINIEFWTKKVTRGAIFQEEIEKMEKSAAEFRPDFSMVTRNGTLPLG